MEALELGFDVNSNDADGMTLLMLVASNGHAELVGKLRVHGADMSKTCKQNNDFDAVMFACVEGHVEVVRLLLDYVGDINKRYSTHSSQGLVGNQTLLSIAANRGRLDICQLLVSRGADMEVVADCGYTPLMWALVNGASQEAAELLLELGANPDPKTKPVSIYKGALSTPLILSASNNLLRVTRRLIDAGVALNAKDFSGWTALKHASHNGSDEIVSALIAAGADLNLPDHEGWTPLISASSRAAWSTIDLLVDAGADVNHQADGGMTALTQVVNRRVMRHNIVLLSRLAGRDLDPVHSAGYEMALVYAKKLLEAGADPNVIYDKDESDNTLIDEVSELGDEELLNLLVDFGAVRSKGTSEDSDYPETGDGLVIAASHGDVDLVAKLLESGVDVNHLDGDGDTALGICVLKLCSEELDLHSARVFLEIIDLLLDYGAQVDVPGCRVAPLPMVVRLGNIALTNSFLRAGANPNAVLTEMMDDEAGKTAVQLAQEYGHDEIVEILLTLKG
jgi:ankyrin repeat protein